MAEQDKDYSTLDGQQLATERTQLAAERNRLAQERTRLAAERNQYALNRTRLANKRTFLAWSRTALAVMTFGFLLERVDAFIEAQNLSREMERELTALGIAAFVVGPLMMLLATWRYIHQARILGFRWIEMLIIPEMTLFFVLIGFTLFHVFT